MTLLGIQLAVENALIEAIINRVEFTSIGFIEGELYAILNGYPERM